jgi:hypothetical protein
MMLRGDFELRTSSVPLKEFPRWLSGLLKEGRFVASEPFQGLKPTGSIGFIGTTKVMPCYKARFERVFPQPVKPDTFYWFYWVG